MNKHILFGMALTAASVNSFAADAAPTAVTTLALYNGSEARLLQPATLNKQTAKAVAQRVDIAVDALNKKLSTQLEAKFAEELQATVR